MFKKHPLLLLTMVGLAVSMGGCVSPAPYAVAPERHTPAPASEPALGNIKGIVHDQEGPSRPLGTAFVTTGSVSATAANPQADQVEEDVDNNKARAYVMKDFGDGNPVLVERRKRVKAGGPNWEDKYVYLKPGEFFLEGVPDGIATLTATYDGLTSKTTVVEVYKNNTRADIQVPIYIPRIDSGEIIPHTVEVLGIEPVASVTVGPQYEPDPSVITVSMQAPAGSAGTVIKGVRRSYSWHTADKRRVETSPPVHPLGPFVVAPARDLQSGPIARLSVPVGSPAIQQSFAQMEAATRLPDPPNDLTLTMHFIDENGFDVLDQSLNPLKVSITIERR